MDPLGNVSVKGEYFRNKSFRTLWAGQTIAGLGDWVATFGLMLFVRELTLGQPYEGLAISGILGFRILPAMVAMPIASSVADRFDRRRTMITASVAKAALVALVPFTPHLAAVYAIAFAMEVAALVFLPARDAVVPGLVEEEHLAGANGLMMLAQWGAIPIAGGFVAAAEATSGALGNIAIIGPLATERFALAFFFNAFALLIGAWVISRLPVTAGRIPPRAEPAEEKAEGARSELSEGTRFMLESKGLRGLLAGMALAAGAGGALFSLGIPYVKTTLGASDAIFGAMIAIWGVGMVLGAAVAQLFRRRESDLFRAALGGCGAILITMSLVAEVWLALAVAVAFGAGISMTLVLGITLAQRTAPVDLRGRVMTAVHVLARIFLILGAVAMGAFATGVNRFGIPPGLDGNRYAFIFAGAGMIAGGIVARGGALRLTEDR